MRNNTCCPNVINMSEDLMFTARCQICGAPIAENALLCMSCEIEKYISERTSQLEM